MAQDASPSAVRVERARPDVAERPRRQRSRRTSATSAQRRRLRFVYFSLASLWGFLIGTATLLFGFSLDGKRVELSPLAIVAMTAAVVLAVVGGLVASRAYREASRRR